MIVNLILCSNITKESISDFIPYIFAPDRIADIQIVSKFVKILSEKDLISTFSKSILDDFDSLIKLRNEVFAYFIPYISDQMLVSNKKSLSSLFAANMIKKCSKLNFNFDEYEIGLLFASLEIIDITPEI